MVRPDRPATGPGLPVQQAGFATAASEMAPMLMHRLADMLEKEGINPREIFQKTGWFRDTDGVWSWEYGDQAMKLNPASRSGKLLEDPYHDIAGMERKTPFRPPMKEADPNMAPGWYRKQGGGYGFAGSGAEKEPFLRLRQIPDQNQLDLADVGRMAANPFTDAMTTNPALPGIGAFRPPQADELFHHPMMFDVTPQLRNETVAASRNAQTYGGTYGGAHGGQSTAMGGMPDAAGNKSMESVALHELSGHGPQYHFNRPRGGNWREPGMAELGGIVDSKAREYDRQFYAARMDEFNSRVAAGENPTTAWADIQMRSPKPPYDTEKWKQGPASEFTPEYRGYQAHHGEAFSRNVEKRATMPTMKYKREPGVGRNVYMTRGGEKVPDPRALEPGGLGSGTATGAVQGDVHPFETLDIPPELLFMRPQTPLIGPATPGSPVLPGTFGGRFPEGDFSWLFRR